MSLKVPKSRPNSMKIYKTYFFTYIWIPESFIKIGDGRKKSEWFYMEWPICI